MSGRDPSPPILLVKSMDEFFDATWEYLYALIKEGAAGLDTLLSPLHFLGPIPVIFFLAFVVVVITRILKKYIHTKRLVELEANFQHWMEIREQATRCEDSEKGRAIAKNIDKAKLNRAYYDYFLESLLLSFVTFMLPVFSMAAYINEYYRAERLMELFGRNYVLKFGGTDPIVCGALFCYICSVVFISISFWIIKLISKRYFRNRFEQEEKTSSAHHVAEQSMKHSSSN